MNLNAESPNLMQLVSERLWQSESGQVLSNDEMYIIINEYRHNRPMPRDWPMEVCLEIFRQSPGRKKQTMPNEKGQEWLGQDFYDFMLWWPAHAKMYTMILDEGPLKAEIERLILEEMTPQTETAGRRSVRL